MDCDSDAIANATIPQQFRGMRVVLAFGSAFFRAELRQCLDREPDFCIAGEAHDWESLAQLVEAYVPEIVVASGELVERGIAELDGPFPLFLRLAAGESTSHNARVPASLDPSCTLQDIRKALDCAKLAVLETKCLDILRLLKNSRGPMKKYLDDIEISSEDRVVTVPVGQVRCITAAKNYVQLDTQSGIFQTRGAISELSARLDPSQFARIHRSVVVNKKEVRAIVERDDVPIAVVLFTGRRLPIGSTYRAMSEELRFALETASRA